MTKAISTLRNSNYGASRQSIMDKYDTNGDGKIDLAELHAFVDDYIINITNNDTLLDRVSNMRRLIGFGTILLVIIALSNLGTAILAANISKDTVIVDGRFVANDGSATAISTTNSVESITKMFSKEGRRKLEDGAADAAASSPHACFTQAEVNTISASSIHGSGTNLIIQSGEDDGSISESLFLIHGTGYFNQTQVSFPESNVQFDLDNEGLCADNRRKLDGEDAAVYRDADLNMWYMQIRDFNQMDCDAAYAGLAGLERQMQACVELGDNTLNDCLPSGPVEGVFDAPDRVLCPDYPIADFCDCEGSCTVFADTKCSCASAVFCCDEYAASLPALPVGR